MQPRYTAHAVVMTVSYYPALPSVLLVWWSVAGEPGAVSIEELACTLLLFLLLLLLLILLLLLLLLLLLMLLLLLLLLLLFL